MTLKDTQQIAHALIQGYIGPDHRSHGYAEFLQRAPASATSGPSASLKDRGDAETLTRH